MEKGNKQRFDYLHLDVKDAPLLFNLLLDSCHGLVEDRQALRALQSGGGHHVTRWSDQVDLRGISCGVSTSPNGEAGWAEQGRALP